MKNAGFRQKNRKPAVLIFAESKDQKTGLANQTGEHLVCHPEQTDVRSG